MFSKAGLVSKAEETKPASPHVQLLKINLFECCLFQKLSKKLNLQKRVNI